MNPHEEAEIRELRRMLASVPNPPPWLRATELLARKVDELELELGLERLRAPAPPPSSSSSLDWRVVRSAVIRLKDYTDEAGPAMTAVLDGNQAFLRDAYDELGLEITDERTLYVSIVAQSLAAEMLTNAIRGGVASIQSLRDLAVVTQTFVASVYDYLPAEAKR